MIAVVGGAAAGTCLAVAFLLTLSRDALLERFKSAQAEALERLKADLSQTATRVNRFEDAEFGTFKEIWQTLADLRMAADRLWDEASPRNINEFGRHFGEVRRVLYGGELVMPGPHLTRLRSLIDEFREFYDGKQGLQDTRRDYPDDKASIAAIIARNGQIRNRYRDALNDLEVSLRQHMVSGGGRTSQAVV